MTLVDRWSVCPEGMDGAGKATSLTEALPLSLNPVPQTLDHWASAHALEESGVAEREAL